MDVELRREVRRAFDDIVAGAGDPAGADRLMPIYPLGPSAPRRSIGVLASMLVALAIVAAVAVVAGDRDRTEDVSPVAAGNESIAAQVQASSRELGVTTGDPCGLSDGSLLRKWWSQELEPPLFVPVVRFDADGECTVGGWVGREHALPGYEVYASGGTGELGEQPIRTHIDIYDEQGRVVGEARDGQWVYED